MSCFVVIGPAISISLFGMNSCPGLIMKSFRKFKNQCGRLKTASNFSLSYYFFTIQPCNKALVLLSICCKINLTCWKILSKYDMHVHLQKISDISEMIYGFKLRVLQSVFYFFPTCLLIAFFGLAMY